MCNWIKRKNLREDRRESCGTHKFDEVHGDCKDRNTENHPRPRCSLDNTLHAINGLCSPLVVGDLARIRILAECFIQVEGTTGNRNDPDDFLYPMIESDEEEHIEPRCNENVVHDPRDEEERPSNHPDLDPRTRVNEKREQGNEHPHRAGIESIESPEDDGEHREREIAEVRLPYKPEIEDELFLIVVRFTRLRRISTARRGALEQTLRARSGQECIERDATSLPILACFVGFPDALPGRLIFIVSLDDVTVDDDGRDPLLETRHPLLHFGEEELRRLLHDFVIGNRGSIFPVAHERLEVCAVRASFAHENVHHDVLCLPAVCDCRRGTDKERANGERRKKENFPHFSPVYHETAWVVNSAGSGRFPDASAEKTLMPCQDLRRA